ncbi:MAG: S-adenosylmethionine:tRNA ribosyltransferase-isomerase [Nevskia sp.]|nr:S-adenosylmethionine:tRNA ribosyltransferase-isomerase [Nevskia sp.]
MRRSDFNYSLPPELIAQRPPERRGESRLLCLESGAALADRMIRDLPAQLGVGDLLVFNDTRVIPARLFGEKASGGRVEILLERLLDAHSFLAQVRASKPLRPGGEVRVDGCADVLMVEAREEPFYRLRLQGEGTVLDLLERVGHIPLPPYIERADEAGDRERYQTIFAQTPGAVAAPTAGLHFDEALLDAMRARGARIETLTLHVGAGTFQPLRVDDLAEHRMHAERYSISPALAQAYALTRAAGGRVVAIGTTSVRALESAAAIHAEQHGGTRGDALQAGPGETRIFITPGYRFAAVDALLTNFHLPESTLLMLVSAFAGHVRVMAAYRHAVQARYRFFSYGDAMWLPRHVE